MAWSQSVFSSMISEVSYDEERQVLTVTFSKGGVYEYDGVAEGTATSLANAPSVGAMFLAEIRDQYPTRRVR